MDIGLCMHRAVQATLRRDSFGIPSCWTERGNTRELRSTGRSSWTQRELEGGRSGRSPMPDGARDQFERNPAGGPFSRSNGDNAKDGEMNVYGDLPYKHPHGTCGR